MIVIFLRDQLLLDLMAFREQALRLLLDLSSTVITLLVSIQNMLLPLLLFTFFFRVFFSSLCVWDCRVYVSSSWIYFQMTYSVQITQKWTLAFKLVGTREWAGQVVLTVECSYLYIILINLFRDIGFSPKEIMWNFIIMIITRSVHEAFILCSMVDVSKFVVSSTFKRLWFNYFLLYCQKLKSLLEIHMDP